MFKNLYRQRQLIFQLTKREIASRYRGSYLGIFWSLVTPIFMLLIYTIVFSVILKPRWQESSTNFGEFALILFCGLIIFNLFAETISRAPALIINNTNYVKKVLFPIEILVFPMIGSALVHSLISFLVLVTAYLIIYGSLHVTILFLPVVLLPMVLFILGFSWLLAATTVYIKDILQLVPIVVSALMFLSPIFYPVSAVPEKLRPIYFLNPLSSIIENARKIFILGEVPSLTSILISMVLGFIFCIFGYFWFIKTKKGFVDVI